MCRLRGYVELAVCKAAACVVYAVPHRLPGGSCPPQLNFAACGMGMRQATVVVDYNLLLKESQLSVDIAATTQIIRNLTNLKSDTK